MLDMKDHMGNGTVTSKGAAQATSTLDEMRGDHVKETQAGVTHGDSDPFPQGKEWITPVLCTEHGERLGTGDISTAEHHLLDLGLTLRHEDHAMSPVQPRQRQ